MVQPFLTSPAFRSIARAWSYAAYRERLPSTEQNSSLIVLAGSSLLLPVIALQFLFFAQGRSDLLRRSLPLQPSHTKSLEYFSKFPTLGITTTRCQSTHQIFQISLNKGWVLFWEHDDSGFSYFYLHWDPSLLLESRKRNGLKSDLCEKNQ